MIWKRQLAIFGIAFALVLGGGMALAAVGTLAPAGDDLGTAEEPYEEHEVTTTTMADGHEREEAVHEEEGSGEAGDHGEESKEEPKEEADTPPKFGITSPKNGTTVENKVVTFEGFVEPGSTVTRGPFTATVDGEHWRLVLVLSPGKNTVGFVATDADGNVSDAAVTVYYESGGSEEPKEEPKEEEPQYVTFTVKQKYGSCGESPPYDVFYGTATPGTKIWIESPYGGKTIEANGDGHWEAKVTFYEVPAGKSFEVVIESSKGDRKVFGFTYTGGHEEEPPAEEGGGEEH